MNKSIFARFIFLIMLFSLCTGCAPVYETQYHYVPPQTRHGQHCVAKCNQQRLICNNTCDTSYQLCELNAKTDARYSYAQLRREQRAAGLPIYHSFYTSNFDDFQCHRNCGCTAGYNSCYQSCGGKVTAERKCVAFCKQN